jgi:diaminopimelate decarboxylase
VNHFQYKGDELYCEGVSLAHIAARVGTPAYVYSHATLERHFKVFDLALQGIPHLVCYSVKANSNLAVLRLLFRLGAGADIVSGGELFRCLRAGVDPKKIVFSGVGKSREEMRSALEANILAFNVESRQELEALHQVAHEMNTRAPISVRVNPDVDPETHPYISTGLQRNKFGVAVDQARELYDFALGLPGLEVVGIDCHIGSQLTKTAPFTDAVQRVAELIKALRVRGVELSFLDIGGGLGIRYGEEESAEPPSPAEYGEAVKSALGPLGEMDLTLICEPGRVVAGNAGVLLTRVLYTKSNPVKNFVIVDAAFNDLLRPAFYDSYHPMRPVRRREDRGQMLVDVVGPICESGDFLARDRAMHASEPGDLIAVGAAGAYGFTMASNYNSRPRAAEVLVKGDQYAIVRRRETVEDLVAAETIPEFLE